MQRREELSHIGFDEVFARMWELYLADREAGFRSGNLNVYQWTFAREGRAMIVDFAVVSGASVAALLVVHTVTFAIGRRIGRYNVVDVAWGLGFIAVAAVAAVLGTGDPTRRWLLLALVAIWGLRLSWHIYRRSAGQGRGSALRRPAARRHHRPDSGQGVRAAGLRHLVHLAAAATLRGRRAHPTALAGRHPGRRAGVADGSPSKPSATISCGYSRPTPAIAVC